VGVYSAVSLSHPWKMYIFMHIYSFFSLKDWMSLISGKAAILEIETKSFEKDSGDLLCMNR